uniref:ornithine carbamoyltransferase n=1 Tax=Paulinella chromatophora TaxID=39717 RepID=B1X3R3_PAUCH|nr:Aspartate and ornithine carbamoyltransferase family protein [Paulinella chromatophora]ACB42582.1 Aspartate and ornithine carbamoyltransferase family protein [Paulinella chromatophora]
MNLFKNKFISAIDSLKGRDLLSSADFDAEQTRALLELALNLKYRKKSINLGNRVLGLVFSKASTRTRVSFSVAMAHLGGQTIDLNPNVTQLGRGESLIDTTRVLSRYCDAIAVRTFGQQELIDYAHWSSVPVLNALTDLEHPCQALADFLTLHETFGNLQGLILTYIGDGNNVAHSLMLCGVLLGVNIRIASPKGFEPNNGIVERARLLAKEGATVTIMNDPLLAVRGANALYTDVWASMGQELEQVQREKSFFGFCLNKNLLQEADNDAIILHCLPAHRGEEITSQVMEDSASRIFDQTENRLYVQQALLAAVIGGKDLG